MGNINMLDEALSNLIAAGEVVERPLSVVKELVENSIDANATSITINLIESGLKEIEVIDDGCGMDFEDAKLCFFPHATSKINSKSDLFRIQTLGFRGEAIPSIAAISDMTLKTSNGVDNTLIKYRAGKLISTEKTNMNKGTIITVKNIFFNTPARLKYMKSPSTELSVIMDFISKIALANPLIRFKISNNQKVLLQTYGNGDITSLIGNVYGLEVAKNIINLSVVGDGFETNCSLVEPYINRTKRDNITLIVNGRVIKNNELMYAVIDAYDTLVPIGRYPIAVINIKIDPILIDVNVHPNKKEIKFSNINDICVTLKRAIKEKLQGESIIPQINDLKYERNTSYEKLELDLTENSKKEEYKYIPKNNSNEFIPKSNSNEVKQNVSAYLNEIKEVFKKEEELPKETIPYMEYIGIFSGTYLLFQNNEGLYLVDQHAAAERIRYEYYYDNLGKNKGSQVLLVPFNIEFNIKDFNYLKENIDIIKEYGFILEESGLNSFYVREIPIFIKDNMEELTRSIFDFIIENKEVNISKIRDSLAKRISCKGAIKANHNILSNEAIQLINKLRECKNPFTCPHGRPTIVKITHYEIEKMFKRVM